MVSLFLTSLFDFPDFYRRHFNLENFICMPLFGFFQVYERGLEYFGEENLSETLLIAFAQFEERQKEHERARVIYRLSSV